MVFPPRVVYIAAGMARSLNLCNNPLPGWILLGGVLALIHRHWRCRGRMRIARQKGLVKVGTGRSAAGPPGALQRDAAPLEGRLTRWMSGSRIRACDNDSERRLSSSKRLDASKRPCGSAARFVAASNTAA